MCIFLSVTYVEFAVITRRHNAVGAFRSTKYTLYVCSRSIVSIYRTVYAQCPGMAGRIDSIAEDFPYIHKHILHTYRIEIACHSITTVTLSDGIVIQGRKHSIFKQKIGRLETAIFRNSLTDIRLETRHPTSLNSCSHLIVRREGTISKTESPDVEKRRGRHINGSFGLFIDITGNSIYIKEVLVRKDSLAIIEPGQDRFLVIS